MSQQLLWEPSDTQCFYIYSMFTLTPFQLFQAVSCCYCVLPSCCLPVASLLPPWWYLCVWRPQWMLPIHSSTPWLTQVPLTLTQDGHIGQPCGIGQRCVLENSWGQCRTITITIHNPLKYFTTWFYFLRYIMNYYDIFKHPVRFLKSIWNPFETFEDVFLLFHSWVTRPTRTCECLEYKSWPCHGMLQGATGRSAASPCGRIDGASAILSRICWAHLNTLRSVYRSQPQRQYN